MASAGARQRREMRAGTGPAGASSSTGAGTGSSEKLRSPLDTREVAPAMERRAPSDFGETAALSAAALEAPFAPASSPFGGNHMDSHSTAADLDVTVLAFAQWISEMKTRQSNASQQLQAEMSIIRNAITTNNTELSDFKRHSTAIQSQMQNEITGVRESLGAVFLEITHAVRNNSSADQDIKLKIQSLNEQAVRNETAFAQLADAAEQSQAKLKNATQEMQHSSERMREELLNLNRHTDSLESTLTERVGGISVEVDQLSQDVKLQLERRKEHLKRMVHDVCTVGDSITTWTKDYKEFKSQTKDSQDKLQSDLSFYDQENRSIMNARDNTAQRRVVSSVYTTRPQASQPQISPQPQMSPQLSQSLSRPAYPAPQGGGTAVPVTMAASPYGQQMYR
eukprot:TRINITY_DN54814_c0_g1_i1.p1 TRINITY_DN54814_c0_g1~~TRINITY_DN54814_c0_g1_i1.p1  ORF type:complete len:396 (-),score=59.15 TRINITY_DN54814_c0_g1_i1:93-1280(-)